MDGFYIDEKLSSLRLDKALSTFIPGKSRNFLQRSLKNGGVKVNGKIVYDRDFKVREGDFIEFADSPSDESAYEIKPVSIDFGIIYEDGDLLVINKPAGLSVHPGAGNRDFTLVNALAAKEFNLSSVGGLDRPGIVHRLDKDTSGLMLVAKNDSAHYLLSEAIKNKEVERKYKALVYSVPSPSSGVIDLPIGRSRLDRKKMSVAKIGGKRSVTRYFTEEIFLGGKASLLRCELETGRTHQIRVHLTHIGNSVIGDKSYGKDKSKILPPDFSMERQALHSFYISFIPPRGGERLEFEIGLPEDMKKAANILREWKL